MRMWLVDPVFMCDKHLLGEHCELHMFVGAINKGISMEGYLKRNLLEVAELYPRHERLAEAMRKRGFAHMSPLPPLLKPVKAVNPDRRINTLDALTELMQRCPKCLSRFQLTTQVGNMLKRAASEMQAPAQREKHGSR